MSTIDWPAHPAFVPREVRPGVTTPKSAYVAPYTGRRQSVGHLADRHRWTVVLPPCDAAGGQYREAWVFALASADDFVRVPMLHRLVPRGTLRGLPTVGAAASAGARSVLLVGEAGATLEAGDMLQLGGQAVMVAPAGAVFDGAGLSTVPLVLPLVDDVGSGAAVVWQRPTCLCQLSAADRADVTVGRALWQSTLELTFVQVGQG